MNIKKLIVSVSSLAICLTGCNVESQGNKVIDNYNILLDTEIFEALCEHTDISESESYRAGGGKRTIFYCDKTTNLIYFTIAYNKGQGYGLLAMSPYYAADGAIMNKSEFEELHSAQYHKN